jgi:hypothetical protein
MAPRSCRVLIGKDAREQQVGHDGQPLGRQEQDRVAAGVGRPGMPEPHLAFA